ncbi:hypothetical protein [Flavobacterium urocaniciphilum]|uniref:Uncharacterized protein n=1 Tax=Flavobacterium urocaniciphilum TaxID=1299341 RepID=A0A1H9DB98_9FLAO|nr:hypothetical protein [Flavobacterium urocaniciphilum]SEQ10641.1 hypothetical protein SAMN05444005_106139 [Flavobacterium urocaniciphilum]
MIRIVISCIAILSTIFYCVWEQNKANTIMNENCIEIYLYEVYVMPKNCVWYKDANRPNSFVIAANKSFVDTIKNQYSHGKEFDLNSKNKKVLLFKNSDILNFNIGNKHKIEHFILNQFKHIKNFTWDTPLELKQFVLCLNKKPIINGYFSNGLLSRYFDDEVLMYSITASESNFKRDLRFLKPIRQYYQRKLFLVNLKGDRKPINLQKDYPELYQAFKNTNRLIE